MEKLPFQKINDPNVRLLALWTEKSIELISLSDLKILDNNARIHPVAQIERLAANIFRFGFLTPIVVDEYNNIVIGQARFEAAKSLGLEQVPAIRHGHLTEQELRICRIADNRLAELAEWDKEKLALEFDKIDIDFVRHEFSGFETAQIDLLTSETPPKQNPDDACPEYSSDAPAITKLGDLWLLGKHRLLCGDSTKEVSYLALMTNEKAQLIVSDFPYNEKIQNVSGNGKVKHREFVECSGEKSSEEFTLFLSTVCEHLSGCSIDGSLHYIFMDWRHMREILNAGHAVYNELKQILAWNKTNGGMGSFYRSKHELIPVFKNGKAPHINNMLLGQTGRYRTNVLDYAGVNTFRKDRDEELKLHPTVKPVLLISDLIRDASKAGDIVLDPFCGSGTILIAATRTKRVARAIELDPLYVDVAIRRWQKFSGQKAFLSGTNLTFDEIENHQLSLFRKG